MVNELDACMLHSKSDKHKDYLYIYTNTCLQCWSCAHCAHINQKKNI